MRDPGRQRVNALMFELYSLQKKQLAFAPGEGRAPANERREVVKSLMVVALATLGLGTSGCLIFAGAPYSTAMIYGDVTYAHSFESLTAPEDKPAAFAHGEACATNILYVVNVGNAGYDAAYRAAMASVGANSLYDVRVDTHITNVLFFYASVCTEVTGKYLK
jgi:hypothetical protein